MSHIFFSLQLFFFICGCIILHILEFQMLLCTSAFLKVFTLLASKISYPIPSFSVFFNWLSFSYLVMVSNKQGMLYLLHGCFKKFWNNHLLVYDATHFFPLDSWVTRLRALLYSTHRFGHWQIQMEKMMKTPLIRMQLGSRLYCTCDMPQLDLVSRVFLFLFPVQPRVNTSAMAYCIVVF